MTDNYFQHQAHLIDIECNFQCPDDCNAPGCRKADIIVEATLFDLIRLGRFLNTPVSHLFSQYCHLGLMIFEDNIRYKRLLIKMKKPCLFLSGNQCVVHDAKPLNCRLFPESYHMDAESEIKNLFEKLNDRVMMEYLMEKMVRPAVVHRLEGADIKQLKRSLQPPAICFM